MNTNYKRPGSKLDKYLVRIIRQIEDLKLKRINPKYIVMDEDTFMNLKKYGGLDRKTIIEENPENMMFGLEILIRPRSYDFIDVVGD